MYSGNPIDDAIMHIHDQDSKPIEFDYTCDCCKQGFNEGYTMDFEHYFCEPCNGLNSDNVNEFYRLQGLSDREIEQLKQLIKRV